MTIRRVMVVTWMATRLRRIDSFSGYFGPTTRRTLHSKGSNNIAQKNPPRFKRPRRTLSCPRSTDLSLVTISIVITTTSNSLVSTSFNANIPPWT